MGSSGVYGAPVLSHDSIEAPLSPVPRAAGEGVRGGDRGANGAASSRRPPGRPINLTTAAYKNVSRETF
jgi:hypothetical protein